MKFGRFAVDDALGVRLAHSLTLPGHKLRKGHLLDASDLARLRAAGVAAVLGARLGDDDVDEDSAAASAGALLAGEHLLARGAAQGRCNLQAAVDGVLLVDAVAIDRLNRIDAALTVGTLAPYSVVRKGQVAATVKTIPFAVAATSIDAWRHLAAVGQTLRLAPLRPQRVALICSAGAATTDKLLGATEAVTRQRIEDLGSDLVKTARCQHDLNALQAELRAALAADVNMILIAGAAVSKDRGDTVPAWAKGTICV